MLKLDINLVFVLINLVVLYLLLKKFLIKPVLGIMEKREAMIRQGLEKAQTSQEEALALKEQYEQALQKAREEACSMAEESQKRVKAAQEEMMAQARREADQILAAARKTVEAEREQTAKGLQGQIAQLAMLAARKAVGDQAGPRLDGQLYDQFLKGAGEAHDSGR